MLKWDGSYLGIYPGTIILAKTKTTHGCYMKLQITDIVENKPIDIYCLARLIKNFFPAIIDELKTIFRLPKLGTHTLHIDKGLYLIVKVPLSKGIIIEDRTLNEIPINPRNNLLFCQQVQEILCFRDLLALPASYERSIHVRYVEPYPPYPLSFHENGMDFTEHKKPIISKHLMKKWFGETSVSTVLLRLLRISVEDLYNFHEILAKYRKDIEETINRVNKDSIWCSTFILSRLSNRLLPLIEQTGQPHT